MDKLRIFLKGSLGTLYENKWWFITVNLSDYHPYSPPEIRFISVPYHLITMYLKKVNFTKKTE